MVSITLLSLILSLIVSIPHAFPYNSNPLIAVLRGVMEKEDSSPISCFWYHPNFTKGDRLVVRNSNSTEEYMYSFVLDGYTGFHTLPSPLEYRGGPDQFCAVIKSEKEDFGEKFSCESKIQWMYDLRDVLKFFTLSDLIIPGTHDSAAYTVMHDDSSHNQSLLRSRILSQTESIKTQLMDGIRYLDFRPSAEYSEGRMVYSLIHNQSPLVLLEDVVQEINEFMNSSKDIVIIAFKGFDKGFNSDQDHLDFMAYLRFAFQDHIHERTHWKHTLNDFWTADRRLILSYDHEIRQSSRFMWPPITHYWGDVQTINQLHSHLAALHQNHENDSVPYAAIVDSTYSEAADSEHSFERDMSLREWSDRLSKYIPLWYTEEWNSSANIVLVNFYQTTGLVDVAIQSNKKRADNFIRMSLAGIRFIYKK